MDTKRQSKKLSFIPTNANEKGIVLVATIALTALLALFGTLGIVTTSTELIISKNYKSSVQARYVAEAGIHRTIGMLNSGSGWIEGINPAINAFLGDNSFGNGTYEVNVYEDDPTPGKVRIITTGNVNGSSSTFEAIVSPEKYEIFDYATFDCGGITLKASNNVISGHVFIGPSLDLTKDGTLDMEDSGIQLIENGDVRAVGDIVIGGTSYITGNAYANGRIDLESDAIPYNIVGTATAGLAVDGTGDWVNKVSEDIFPNVSPPDPVINLCDADLLGGKTITSDDIQKLRVKANDTFGNYEYMSADDLSGIVHITGDFELTVDSTFSANLLLIVDGSVDISARLTTDNGSYVLFLVPNGSFKVKGGGDVEIDGSVLVGTVTLNDEGKVISSSGGDVKVTEGSNLTINGSVIVVNGDTDANLGGTFDVNYQAPPEDGTLTKQGSYAMFKWREIRN